MHNADDIVVFLFFLFLFDLNHFCTYFSKYFQEYLLLCLRDHLLSNNVLFIINVAFDNIMTNLKC